MTDPEKLDRLICRGRISPPSDPPPNGLPFGWFFIVVLAMGFVLVGGVVALTAFKPGLLSAHHERVCKCR